MNHDPEPLEPQKRDHYADLGLTEHATDSDIRRAHRKLALEHHPDKGGNPVDFRLVQEAYEFLSNLDYFGKLRYDRSLPHIDVEWNNYQREHSAWVNRQEVRKRREQKRDWQRQERQRKADEQFRKEHDEHQERVRRQRAAEEDQRRREQERLQEQEERRAREEMEATRQRWLDAQDREKERIKRDQEERARAAEARLRRQQELDQKKKQQREEEEAQQKAQEQARKKALTEEHARRERQRLAEERERVQAERARQRQEEAARGRLDQDKQHKGHHTEVRLQEESERLDHTEREAAAREADERAQKAIQEDIRLREKQRLADDRSRRAAEAAQARQAEAARQRLERDQMEERTRERKIPKPADPGPKDAYDFRPREEIPRSLRLHMARAWAHGKHRERLAQVGGPGHEEKLMGEYIEIHWTKKAAKGKCDFCKKNLQHWMFECPDGGALACWPCKNRFCYYGA